MDKSRTPMTTIAELFLAARRAEGKTLKTLKGYKQVLAQFNGWVVINTSGVLADFTIATVREYIRDYQQAERYADHPFSPPSGRPVSMSTVANHVRVLKSLSTWLFEEQYTREAVLDRLRIPKAPRKLSEVLSDDEVDRLLAAFDVNAPGGCRDRAISTLLLDTGLRASELLGLRVEDVDFDGRWLKVMGKGQKERIVPFGNNARQMMLRYVMHFRPECEERELFFMVDGRPLTYSALQLLFRRLRQKTGIKRLQPHLLRHTFATTYLMRGGDVFSLQSILGHTTLEMVRRYVQLASTHLSVQHDRFSPMDARRAPLVGRPKATPPAIKAGQGLLQRQRKPGRSWTPQVVR